MPIQYDLIKSGGKGERYFDVTVVFHTSKMTESDVAQLVKKADLILHRRVIHKENFFRISDATREIEVFYSGGKTVAIFHYECSYGDFLSDVFLNRG